MQLLEKESYLRKIWKNGKGITHEIFRLENSQGIVWRLSIAEVITDGPFSCFEGYKRILTVIKGNGLELSNSKSVFRALPYIPKEFSGNLAINSKRILGNVENLNLIFKPTKVQGAVCWINKENFRRLKFFKKRVFGLFCLEGKIEIGKSIKLKPFSTLLFSRNIDTIHWSIGSSALLITIDII